MKGQLTFEQIISLVVFVSLVSYILYSVFSYIPAYLRQIRNEELKSEAYQISEMLINDPGDPPNWEKMYDPVNPPTWKNGLVGYWRFDEGNNITAYDSSGNRFNGILQGPAWACGAFGNALSYNRNKNAWVAITSSGSLSTLNQFSISAWVNYTPPGSGNDPYIVRRVGGDSMWLYVQAASPLKAVFGFYDGAYKQVTTTGAIPTNQWTNIVGAYDGATLSIYINGIFNNNLPASGTMINQGGDVLIGNYNKGNMGIWSGLIDQVQIWNRSLTQNEITQIYNFGPSEISRLGLSNETLNKINLISYDKLNKLNAICFPPDFNGYDTISKAIGTDHQFSISTSGIKCPILVNCTTKSPIQKTGTALSAISRIVAIDSSHYCELEMQVW